VRRPRFSLSRFQRRGNRNDFFIEKRPGELKDAYKRLIMRRFRHVQTENAEGGFTLFAEKWRWTRLGVYIVHSSVILLLFGGLVGSLFGFEGFVNIPEGETVDTIRLRNTGALKRLDFSVRCDDFSISFYDTGQPKEYRSRLSVIEDGTVVFQRDIIVNDPLRYKGINLFQSSYGEMQPQMQAEPKAAPEAVTLSFSSAASGLVYHREMAIGDAVDLPEQAGRFTLVAYQPRSDYMGQPLGAALVGRLEPETGVPVDVLLPLNFPNFDKMRKGQWVVSILAASGGSEAAPASPAKRYYTGLQVTRDPGVWIVYAGFILMILGCFITFFMAHQQVCVHVSARDAGSRVWVAGIANRNKMTMARRVEEMAARMGPPKNEVAS
jgi:cytochrome c biogenesis protein